MWWLLPTAVLCGVGEVLGWSGRLWSAISPLADNPFLIQYVQPFLQVDTYANNGHPGLSLQLLLPHPSLVLFL